MKNNQRDQRSGTGNQAREEQQTTQSQTSSSNTTIGQDNKTEQYGSAGQNTRENQSRTTTAEGDEETDENDETLFDEDSWYEKSLRD